MTFHRWDELECGDSNDFNSWAIERDETTGKPYMHVYPHNGKSSRRPIADRERGAQRRLDAIMTAHPEFIAYHQGDCRGAALYLLRRSDLRVGESVDSVYTRGFCVAA